MDLTVLAAKYEDKPAVVMGESGETLTYRQLEDRSNQIAHLFRDRGLRAGSHIAILMKNELDIFPIVWAAQRCGLLYTPVNWHLAIDEISYVVDNCDAELLLHSKALAAPAQTSFEAAPRLRECICVGSELDEMLDGMSTAPVSDQVEGYYMFYSSGTTGRPKGIVPELAGQPFGAGIAIDHMMGNAFGFDIDAVYLSPGPLYHAAPLGWTVGTVRNGGTAVVMEKFDALRALELIDRYVVTHAQFVPTMFVRMLKLSPADRSAHDVSSLKCVVHAGAPCPDEVKDRMIEWFGEILVEFYSGSEGTGFCMIDSTTWRTHRGSVGRAVRGVPHICDDDGVELPPGEIGTIWFSDTPGFEYHRDPAKTHDAFDDRGWTTLGDLGHLDSDGYLYLSARRTDLILSGGVNIYPREIEDVLVLHPDVLDVAVVGLPDAEMGQRVHAVVQRADGVADDESVKSALIEFCRDRLAHFKAPTSISFDTVPRLPSGKLLRRALNVDDLSRQM